ncbi:MAG: ribonuclease III [Caldiserica bacterium]|nr:ribonuclease III [Caldisericota bacterium]
MKNKRLLTQALTHPSALPPENVHEGWERLEFLGDAVLELALSEALYVIYPDSAEGELTQRRAALVNQTSLAKKAREIHLGEMLILGKGEERSGGRSKDSILADAMEALFGAYFLEKGYEKAKRAILGLFKQELHSPYLMQTDYKSILQEYAQKFTPNLPVYQVVDEKGLPHARIFVVKVSLKGYHSALGSGTTKKAAEQQAARVFLLKNGILKDELVR